MTELFRVVFKRNQHRITAKLELCNLSNMDSTVKVKLDTDASYQNEF